MKRNLFVMHTQYNLILATGIALSQHAGEDNDLIVYPEFSITPAWKERLQSIYRKVYFVREAYADPTPGIRGIREAAQQIQQCGAFLELQYDEVVISQDRLFEGILVAKLRKKNPNCRCTAVEENVYFATWPVPEKMDPRKRIKRWVKSCTTKWITGVKVDMVTPYCFGGSSYIDALYVNYPTAIRKELLQKPCIEIKREAIIMGIRALYFCEEPDPMQQKTVIILSDLLSRYANKEAVTCAFMDVASWCKKQSIRLLIKYHPREDKKIPFHGLAEELPTEVAVEKMLLEFKPSQTLVVGNVSASVEMAAKLGFTVVSVLNFTETHQAYQACLQWGVQVPATKKELYNILSNFNKE